MKNYDSYFLKFTKGCWDVVNRNVPEYSSKYSRKDYTLQQHVAMLCLKIKMKQKYREFVDMLSNMPYACEIIGLDDIPHYTTLDKVFLKLRNLILAILLTASAGKQKNINATIDATGFDRRYASKQYLNRCGMHIKSMKTTILVNVDNQNIIDVHCTTTKKHDSKIVLPFTEEHKLKSLCADMGYDDKKVRDALRMRGIRPLIPHRDFNSTDKVNNAKFNQKDLHKRSLSETVNSVIKRKYSDTLFSKNWRTQFKEIKLMAIVYNIERNLVIYLSISTKP